MPRQHPHQCLLDFIIRCEVHKQLLHIPIELLPQVCEIRTRTRHVASPSNSWRITATIPPHLPMSRSNDSSAASTVPGRPSLTPAMVPNCSTLLTSSFLKSYPGVIHNVLQASVPHMRFSALSAEIPILSPPQQPLPAFTTHVTHDSIATDTRVESPKPPTVLRRECHEFIVNRYYKPLPVGPRDGVSKRSDRGSE